MAQESVLFKRVDYPIEKILHYIDISYLCLPDIHRPLVWSPPQVRDLFDSIYKGFPVGFLLFWSHPSAEDAEQIGSDGKVHRVPSLLVVDGQQRLTSLYTVSRGIVSGAELSAERFTIAFRPRDGRFEVCDAIIKRDPEFIPDISVPLSSGQSCEEQCNAFLARLRESKALIEAEMERMRANIKRLLDISSYPLTALQIAPTVHELQVADIVLRVNREGVEIKDSDLVMTLLSVFGEDLRVSLEEFCRHCERLVRSNDIPSGPAFIVPCPDQLLRCAAALAFHRTDRHAMFHLLRGIDLNTEVYSDEKRKEQFDKLQKASKDVLSWENWHGYFNALANAGFVSEELLGPTEAVLFNYVYYLMAKTRHSLDEAGLNKLIGRLYYASMLAGRYTGPFEKELNDQLRLIKDLQNGTIFAAALEQVIRETLGPDLWLIRVPTELETSNAHSPAVLAYTASQILLDAPVLFSSKKIKDAFLCRSSEANRRLHQHLFSPSVLAKEGLTDPKIVNQAANLCVMEWPAAELPQGEHPAEYVPVLQDRIDPAEWEKMCTFHALPEDWHKLPYHAFLAERRSLMAELTRQAMKALE